MRLHISWKVIRKYERYYVQDLLPYMEASCIAKKTLVCVLFVIHSYDVMELVIK